MNTILNLYAGFPTTFMADNAATSSSESAPQAQSPVKLEGGTYEIIKKRLDNYGKDLQQRLHSLNLERKNVFGAIDTKLLANNRVSTENNCIPRDMIPVGDKFIFGYNVHMGLKSEIDLSDVFSVYAFDRIEHSFSLHSLELIANKEFESLFKELYKYYKNTTFSKFAIIGPHLFMVFQIGKSAKDIKTFKWLIKENEEDITQLHYIDNRSDHEFKYPSQHEFEWKRTRRDYHRKGKHPHISIEDKIFVETIHGDLTIKIEDNTDTGEGIYSEKVEHAEQSLDDAEFHYANLGNLILLKVKPYQESTYRYIIYNDKLKKAFRVDAIKEACILLPDSQGLIFSNGYYLQSGELKQFDNLSGDAPVENMQFEKRIASPNGEDVLFVFYNDELGVYILLSYNIIEQKVENPIVCNGFSLFENGELTYFKSTPEPTKTHAIQIWQTPYVGADYTPPIENKNYLYKVGNKDIVRAMAECNDVLHLIEKDDVYATLYLDLVKKTTNLLDGYYWLNQAETFELNKPLLEIKTAATAAIDEFEKVVKVKKNTQHQTQASATKVKELHDRAKKTIYEDIDQYVRLLADLRGLRGEIISLKDLRYVDMALIELLEAQLEEQTKVTSQACVAFLLKENSLTFYQQKVDTQRKAIEGVQKVTDATAIEQQLDASGKELELLIEIVSNLKIADATQTTRIIDNVSTIYATLNQVKAALKTKKKDLLSVEALAEFNAQMKLIGQGIINFLDICDSPQKCEEYLTKLMVQVEELEGKFIDFDEFVSQLTEKREEIYAAFEAKKLTLTETRNKKATSLMAASERILKGIANRCANFKTINEINGYFAADMMVDKIRDLVGQLIEMDDNVKADDIQSKLKTIREDAVRQLKDRQDLFVDGQNIIKLGKHAFSVNVQNLDLTILSKDGDMYYHLTGTNFFEKITDASFLATRPVWQQELVSENEDVYRAEYLAYTIHREAHKQAKNPVSGLLEADLLAYVQQCMAPRYAEGYVKGVHEYDATKILKALLELDDQIDLLRYSPSARACASFFWQQLAEDKKSILHHRLKGIGVILQVFPHSREFGDTLDDIRTSIDAFIGQTNLFPVSLAKYAAAYLFRELTRSDHFIISQDAANIYQQFNEYLRQSKFRELFEQSLAKLEHSPVERFELARHWLQAFVQQQQMPEAAEFIDEAAWLIYQNTLDAAHIIPVSTRKTLTDFLGTHAIIENKHYVLNYNAFMLKLDAFEHEQVPRFLQYVELKKNLAEQFREELRLNEFKPRVLSSFVRNKLIDQLYLPLVGDNLAKQIGVAGEQKRTDLMGMLLLVSPPGYGKTTLMEYVASRLGLIFMKINGPAIGHRITSLDPTEAPNASSREELNKLNLAFEMGDNVMIYVDDIQHCNPEFLQKFISLCDGQRKIEGVYKGKSKTYDLRGKKVCVVMAGNPYTESGDKFQIPDMLANRADTYNLGDIIGDTEEIFKLSYLENCLTSNPVLNKLAMRSQKDIYTLIKLAETDSREGLDFEASYSSEEINEYASVIKKLVVVRDYILRNNLEYIRSAAQSDEFRTEPSFKLQGSYRNMNKIAAKVVPIMNDAELHSLVLSHYESESQTLTTGAEANMLKFKELNALLSEAERQRWEDIKRTFQKNMRFKGLGNHDQMGQILVQLSAFSEGLGSIKEVIAEGLKNGKNGA